MAFLSEVIQWVQVYQLETADPVEGGPSGVSNTPLKNLTDRSAWLKKHVDDLESGAFVVSIYAPINSANLTGSPTSPTPPLGNRTTRIATTEFVHGVSAAVLTKSVAGDQNVTLTADEAGNGTLVFTGALTGNISVIVPATARGWVVRNNTSGAFTLTVKTAAGTGIVVTQGRTRELHCDGTNVLASTTDFPSPAMTGVPTAPTATAGTATTQIATTAFVTGAIAALPAYPVTSVAGKTGAVTLAVADITGAAPIASPDFTGTPTAPTPDAADNSTKLATTAWVQGLLGDLPGSPVLSVAGKTGVVTLVVADVSGAAPSASPTFTGVPAGPTAAGGTNTTQFATCAFVQAAITPLAPLAGPTFSGAPAAPTPAADDNSTRIATTAYVQTQAYTVSPAMDGTAAAGISARWARGDHVHPTDTSRAAVNSPTLTGTPLAPTATQDTNTTQIATTAFVLAQAGATTPAMDGSAAAGTAVRFARADHIHPTDTSRAPLNSPTFTGVPAAPTAAVGNNSTQIATTAFVMSALTGVGAAPVSSVAGKTGAVTLVVADVSGAAPLASPTFTGLPTAPTAGVGSNSTQLATTAFVAATVAGLAPIASPNFSGTPTAPTPSAGDASTKLATTAFVSQNGMKNMQLISASTTFTVPAGVTRLKVTITGGGAGGGGKNASTVGGGGGAGGTAIGFVSVSPGQSISVTIGGGGSGGNTGDGVGGGSSSFGGFLSAGGGNPGLSSSGNGGGGLGGGASGGSANISGGSGGDGSAGDTTLQGGHGGASYWGGGGRAGIGAGAAGLAYGSGGGAAWYNASGYGGAGAPGVCLVEW